MKKIIEILSNDKFPFIITLIFGIIGWGIVHIVDRTIKLPIIEYSISEKKISDNIYDLIYTFNNIKYDKKFENVKIYGNANNNSDSIIIIQPIFDEDSHTGNDVTDLATKLGGTFSYYFHQLQPKGKVALHIRKYGSKIISFRYSAKTPILMMNSSIQTILLKNESATIITLIIFCVAVISIYLIRL